MTHALLDHAAIQEVLVRYATAIDTHAHELLDDVFTTDAMIDYTETQGPVASYAEIRTFLVAEMQRFRILQHLLSNSRVELDGDRAQSKTYVRAIHGMKTSKGMQFFEMGGEYVDTWVRTRAGWRISTRKLRALWFQGEVATGDA